MIKPAPGAGIICVSVALVLFHARILLAGIATRATLKDNGSDPNDNVLV